MVNVAAGPILFELAPYALVRVASLPYPAQSHDSRPFRKTLELLASAHEAVQALSRPLADSLYLSAAQHSMDFHRTVVLPLRRSVHNGRQPRAAVLAALGNLPSRVPLLQEWLDLMARAAMLRAELTRQAPFALAAEREALGAVYTAEALRMAASITSMDLLHGLDRVAAAGRSPQGKARRNEPNAVRYALRATSKTSPLSWFTQVAWARWNDDGPRPAVAEEPVAVVRANMALFTVLMNATLRRLVDLVEVRLASGLRIEGGRIEFRRDVAVEGGGRVLAIREEAVGFTYSAPAALIVTRVRSTPAPGVLLAVLAEALTDLLVDVAADRNAAHGRALAYVCRMVDVGLLVPVSPVDPQDTDAVATFATWLADRGEHDTAALLQRIDDSTRSLVQTSADGRPQALVHLSGLWREALDRVDVAAPVGAYPVSEDVVQRGTRWRGRHPGPPRAVSGAVRPAGCVPSCDT
jgi:hypothetical protein